MFLGRRGAPSEVVSGFSKIINIFGKRKNLAIPCDKFAKVNFKQAKSRVLTIVLALAEIDYTGAFS